MGDFWVFGYGSLMWRPGFAHTETHRARLNGYRRALPGELRGEVTDYLRARELVTQVYLERTLPVRLDTGEAVAAMTYIVDRGHPQYAGAIDVEDAAGRVSGSVGVSGPNEEYVFNTVTHLRALGIRDHWLETVAGRLAQP